MSVKEELMRWLDANEYDVFLTVTLKKSNISNDGTHTKITDADVEKVARFMRNNITRRLCGRRRRLNFAPFVERSSDGRLHLHILFSNPRGVPIHKLNTICNSVVKKNEWTAQQWDVKGVYDKSHLLSYCLKTGSSAFIPEGCSVQVK